MWGDRSETIKENELTEQELSEINAQQEEELKNNDLPVLTSIRAARNERDFKRSQALLKPGQSNGSSLRDYENREIEALSKLNGKVRKSLSASIGAYNIAQRRLDNLNPYLSRSAKSKYPCGSITCKQRGRKIKNALIDLTKFSDEALGSIGVFTFVKSAVNYLVGNNDQTRRREQQVQDTPTPPPPPKEKKGWFWGGKTRKYKRFYRKSRR